jgi:nucleotidyltransferase substrate binding protein (TIGR01987 family)
MSTGKDIRWEQRFSNYRKALSKLSEAVKFVKQDVEENAIDLRSQKADELLDGIVKEGLIQRFEYTHELVWKVMKDFLAEVGELKIYGSKDATRAAFKEELISDGDVWMEMINSRNKTLNTYNQETADKIYTKLCCTIMMPS